jgi:excinuclease ABC subunit B
MFKAAATGSSAAAEDYVTIEYVQKLYEEMLEAAKSLEFERAQILRDQIVKLEGELKKKHGDKAPPSVLGGKTIPVRQAMPKKKGKWKKA